MDFVKVGDHSGGPFGELPRLVANLRVPLSGARGGHSGGRWVDMGVASTVLPALARTRNAPRRVVGGVKPGRREATTSY